MVGGPLGRRDARQPQQRVLARRPRLARTPPGRTPPRPRADHPRGGLGPEGTPRNEGGPMTGFRIWDFEFGPHLPPPFARGGRGGRESRFWISDFGFH